MVKFKGLIRIKEFGPLTDSNIKDYQKIVAKKIKEGSKRRNLKMKTQKGMKTLITKWSKKASKKYDADCLVYFEDNDNRSFFFKFDGFLWDCLSYSGEFYNEFIESFMKIFEGTGWGYEHQDSCVIVVYKED